MKQEALSIAIELTELDAQLPNDVAARAAEMIRRLVNEAYPEKTQQDEIDEAMRILGFQ
jgi:hypothetical protein